MSLLFYFQNIMEMREAKEKELEDKEVEEVSFRKLYCTLYLFIF